MPETSTNAGITYAPRSPDLSSSSFSNNASNNSYQAPASHEHIEQRTELRGGYAPRSPRISPYSETPPTQHNPDRRTSYVPPTLHNYASKSPEVVNFQRRHSAYIPPTDLPSLNTNYADQGSTYTSPVYTRPQAGFFSTSEPPSHQGYKSGYSIPQSALTYQPPINSLQHSQSLPPTTPNEFKPPYMRDLKLEDPNIPQLQNQPHKMETDNGLKMENGGSMGDVPISLGGSTGGASKGIEVKTKFPVARIKRIMQADEEVGKVAQVTPVVVSKALELFMISLVTKSADLARAGNSKRVTAVHLKKTIEADEQFDFLNEIVAKVADGVDAGQEKSKRSKSVDESESEEKPKAKKGRKKRGD